MKILHITFHDGTKLNIENVCRDLGYFDQLTTEKSKSSYYISEEEANIIWNINKNRWKEYDICIFTDTSMLARPFLQNMEDHEMKIIIYVTNRFNWGLKEKEKEFYELYKRTSEHPRVYYNADNHFDRFYTMLYGVFFYSKDIIRCHPKIVEPKEPLHSSFFIYHRGTDIKHYQEKLDEINIEYDIFGEGHKRFRDLEHIAEYRGIIHLPYQTNVQSLFENLGYCNIYFIPSKRLLTKWIKNEDWYYWEEKNKFHRMNIKPYDMTLKSIELSEWYQPENEEYFVYFEDWVDLKIKIQLLNFEEKKKKIYMKIQESNQKSLEQWNYLFRTKGICV